MKLTIVCNGDPSVGIPAATNEVEISDLTAYNSDEREVIRDAMKTAFETIYDSQAIVTFEDEWKNNEDPDYEEA